MMFRISGRANRSKGVNYPYFIPNVFYDHDSAANVAKTIIDGIIKKYSDKDVYSASIEGRKVLFYEAYNAMDTFSAICDENVMVSLNIFPIKQWPVEADILYTYRGYDIVEVDGNTWDIMASGFKFGSVTKDNIEAALLHIDHMIFEDNLRLGNNDEEDE